MYIIILLLLFWHTLRTAEADQMYYSPYLGSGQIKFKARSKRGFYYNIVRTNTWCFLFSNNSSFRPTIIAASNGRKYSLRLRLVTSKIIGKHIFSRTRGTLFVGAIRIIKKIWALNIGFSTYFFLKKFSPYLQFNSILMVR